MALMKNPLWADNLVKHNCDRIVEFSKLNHLPLPKFKQQCVIFEELGHGAHGAVYPTERPGVILKLTNDETEAHFYATAIALKRSCDINPSGVVRCDAVRAVNLSKKKPVFLIWREEVTRPSLPEGRIYERFSRTLYSLLHVADAALNLANNVRKETDDDIYWSWMKNQYESRSAFAPKFASEIGEIKDILNFDMNKLDNKLVAIGSNMGIDLMAWLLCASESLALALEIDGSLSRYVGEAIKTYIQSGILLADVHANNVGTVERNENVIWAIHDPGHALVLKQSLSQIEVEVLK